VSFISPQEQRRTLKPEDVARAAFHALTAAEAVGILYLFSKPGMPAHIDANRAIKRTDPALDAAGWLCHHMATGQDLASARFRLK